MTPRDLKNQLRCLNLYLRMPSPSRGLVATKLQKLAANLKSGRSIQASGRRVPMGPWDDVDHFWPDLPDFEIDPQRKDAFGDWYEVWYQSTTLGYGVIVEFDANDFVNTDGRRPGTYKASYMGKKVSGRWDSLEDIVRVLKGIQQDAEDAKSRVESTLKHMGGSNWESDYDGYDLTCTFKNPNDNSDAFMYVVFPNVAEVVLGGGDAEEATVEYAAGSDYEGHYGEKKERRVFRNLKDIERLLDDAEKRLWPRWTSTPA